MSPEHDIAAQGLIHALGELAPREALAFAADLRRRGKLADTRRWQAIAEAAEQMLQARARRKTRERGKNAAAQEHS